MKQNIIKKSVLYSMLLGLLACNHVIAMDQNNQNENKRHNFGLTDQNTYTGDEDVERFDSRHDDGTLNDGLALIDLTVCSGGFSFLQGLLTPQNSNIYCLLNLFTAMQSLKLASVEGRLKNVLHNKQFVSSLIIPYISPLLLSAALYGAGFLSRFFITKHVGAPNNYTTMLLTYAPCLLLNFVLSKYDFFNLKYESFLLYRFSRSRSPIYNEELFEKIVDIVKKTGKNDEKKLFERFANNFFSMHKDGFAINKFFGIALKKNNRDVINFAMNYYKENSAAVLYAPYIFTEAINWNEEDIFDQLLAIGECVYRDNKIKNAQHLIDLFLKVVYEVVRKAETNDSLSVDDKKRIYDFLEKFFEVIQRMGYNPYSLDSYSNRTPIITSLLSYNAIIDVFNNTISVDKNSFLEQVIHYFVEMGVPLYEHKNDPEIRLNGYLQTSTLNTQTLNARTPFDIAVAMGNLEMQNYFKLIGSYNKQLFNVNEDITNIKVLEQFIIKLKSEEQDAIFRVAATRGHMKPLAILGKIDDKKYSMDEALKLAQKRNLTKIVTNLEKYKTISQEVIDEFKSIGINENTVKAIVPSIKDIMVIPANSKKFDIMINQFRN